MSLGLKKAPSTLRRAMNIVLSTVNWQFALVYLDDVIMFWRSVEDHLDHLRTVLELLPRAEVSSKLKTCFFFEDRIDYLGHVIPPARLGISTKATDEIHGLKHDTTVTEIKSFLGLVKYLDSLYRVSPA